MVKIIQTDGYTLDCVAGGNSGRVVYMIYPAVSVFTPGWLEDKAARYGVSVVVVYVPADRWNDDLTPWPEPPEAKGFEPFAGRGAGFFSELTEKIIPAAEKALDVAAVSERDLAGVSLAGLFTLWQWLQHTTFSSIACLSGSFWYDGFIEWFDGIEIPRRQGKAYFLLGVDEPKAKIKAYRSVGANTDAVVARLRGSGINVEYDSVPGNHFSDPVGRAEKALAGLLG